MNKWKRFKSRSLASYNSAGTPREIAAPFFIEFVANLWVGWRMGNTLMLPFDSGMLQPPLAGQNWCVLNADIA